MAESDARRNLRRWGCGWWWPPLQLLDEQGHHGPTLARKVGAKIGQMRGPTCDRLSCCRDQDDFDPYCGVRVGEASHPGPASASATARKRSEGDLSNLFDGAGLEALIKPIIEKVIREIIKKLLRGGLFAQMAEKEIANQAAGGLGALLGERASGSPQAAKGENKPKGKGMKGKDGAEVSKGKGRDAGVATATPGGTGADGSKTQAKGPDMRKGKSKGAMPTPVVDLEGEGEWVEVVKRRPTWTLRQQDWNDPVIAYDAVADQLSELEANKVFRAVVTCDKEQIEATRVMLAGSGKQHATLLITPDRGPMAQRCPGDVGGRLAFRQVAFTRIASRGLEPPLPKRTMEAVKYDEPNTCVLYAKFQQRYLPKVDWFVSLRLYLTRSYRAGFEHWEAPCRVHLEVIEM